MQFTYHKDSGQQILIIDGEQHKYLFKIRRQKATKNLFFRNLEDTNIYEYKIISIDKKQTQLELVRFEEKIIMQDNILHIGWCIIDPKIIEKTIESLNELGVAKISFIKCAYSQRNFKINFERINKLLINSSQQCGRSNLMQLNIYNSIDDFIKEFPNTYMFNFSNNILNNYSHNIDTILIGCEGGFSDDEISKISQNKIIGINSSLILKSQTAILSIASKLIL